MTIPILITLILVAGMAWIATQGIGGILMVHITTNGSKPSKRKVRLR